MWWRYSAPTQTSRADSTQPLHQQRLEVERRLGDLRGPVGVELTPNALDPDLDLRPDGRQEVVEGGECRGGARRGADSLAGQEVDAVVQRQLDVLGEIVLVLAELVLLARHARMAAADEGDVPGVLRRDACSDERRDRDAVVVDADAVDSLSHRPNDRVPEAAVDAVVVPHRERRLLEAEVVGGLEAEEREVVGCVAAVGGLPAEDEVLDAVLVKLALGGVDLIAKADDLVRLEEEALDELLRPLASEAPRGEVGGVVWEQVLVEAARRIVAGAADRVHQEVEEPDRLQRLVEGPGWTRRHLAEDGGHLPKLGRTLGRGVLSEGLAGVRRTARRAGRPRRSR